MRKRGDTIDILRKNVNPQANFITVRTGDAHEIEKSATKEAFLKQLLLYYCLSSQSHLSSTVLMKRYLPLVLFYFCALTASYAIPEQNYSSNYNEHVAPFLAEHEVQFSFPSADGKYQLSAVCLIHPNPKGVIVILQGRCESWLIYGEVFYDLYQKGYSIFAYDHRGQGLSPHLVAKNPQIGHIEQFDDYVNDLETFLTTIVLPTHRQKEGLFLLTHSMGGAIATAYLEHHTSPFEAVAMTSPMFKIDTGSYLAYNLEETLNATADDILSAHHDYYTYSDAEENLLLLSYLACSLGYGEEYAPGETDYNFSKKKDIYTSSEPRWSMMTSFVKSEPKAILGGISWRWLEESLRITPQLLAQADRVSKTRLLLLQAGSDQIIVNSAHDEFLKRLSPRVLASKITLPQAQHELLMEQDDIRERVLNEIDNWFDSAH